MVQVFICLISFLSIFNYAVVPQSERPPAKSKNYPVTVTATPQRATEADQEWTRLLDTFGLKSVKSDLYPVTQAPRSLSSIQGGIKILTVKPQPKDEEVAVREAAKRFIDRWRTLLQANPDTVSLTNAERNGNVSRLRYQQADYPFPIAGGYGELTLVISNDGLLTQIDDRFIPVVDIPFKPTIDRQTAEKKVIGRNFTYKDIAGRDQQVTISDAKEITVKGLVILPIEKKDALEIHLAWQITAGAALPFTVYIDAIDGTELLVQQNFRT